MTAVVTMPERFGLPPTPSRAFPCVRCGASTWLPIAAGELGRDDVALCVVCAMAVVRPGDLVARAPWAMEIDVEVIP